MVSRRVGAAHRSSEEQRKAFGAALRELRGKLEIRNPDVLVEPMRHWLESVGRGELAVLGGQIRNWESDGTRTPRSSPPYPVQVWALERVLDIKPGTLATKLGMEPFKSERAWTPRLPTDRSLDQVVEELEARVTALESARLPVGRGRK